MNNLLNTTFKASAFMTLALYFGIRVTFQNVVWYDVFWVFGVLFGLWFVIYKISKWNEARGNDRNKNRTNKC